MTSLAFPDVNIWLALASSEHVHHAIAKQWWKQHTGLIAFSRFTQLGFLRLVTMALVMDGKPLTNSEAMRVYDRFFDDDRVIFVSEPPDVEKGFREKAASRVAAPNLWTDAWLLAVADGGEGKLVTFDRALAARGAICLLANKE
jgi:uncharacterized protein